jgi:hypothetical protein
MMGFDPLLEIPGVDPSTVAEGGMVAKLRYQQTKIDGAPNTILIGRDVVDIVREQQGWVRERWALETCRVDPLPVSQDHRQPARHQVLGNQQLQPRAQGVQRPTRPA